MRSIEPACYPKEANRDGSLVWIASFPKSGNTWTRILLANFLRDESAESAERILVVGNIASSRQMFDDAIGLPSSDLTAEEVDLLRPASYRIRAQAGEGMAFIKVHDACRRNAAGEWLFPADCSRGAILLVRHPIDVALSYAHHIGHGDMARAVDRLCDPGHVMGGGGKNQTHQPTLGWSGHFLSWTRQDAIPVLVIRYEDMLADTAAALTQMLTFLGIPGADDDERVARAVERSRFERLQDVEAREGFAEMPVNAQKFFRSGRAGEGIETLPDDLKRRLIDEHGAVMAELGYSPSGAEPRWSHAATGG